MRPSISFKVKYENSFIEINTYPGEYRNLMSLLKDRLCLDSFGECGGMGRCGTCMIKTEYAFIHQANSQSNETSTLLKKGIMEITIRLSCQILITTFLQDAIFEIVEG